MLNLFLAVFWIIVGAACLGWHLYHPEDRLMTILGTDFSIGWVAFLLALYNTARWWTSRASAAQQRAQEDFWLRRRSEQRGQPRPAPPPDPNFNFSEEINSPQSPQRAQREHKAD